MVRTSPSWRARRAARAALIVAVATVASLDSGGMAKGSTSDAEASARVAEARRAHASGRFRQAASTLEHLLNARPDHVEALLLLCEVRTADADSLELDPLEYAVIRRAFETAAEVSARAAIVERAPAVAARRAWAHDVVHGDRDVDAVPAFEAWAAAEPNDPHAVGGLAAWLEEAGRAGEADAILSRAASTSAAFGQRVRFEFVCRSAEARHADRVLPILEAMRQVEANAVGREMIDVLTVSVQHDPHEGVLAFLDLVDRGAISDADAHHLWSCFADESVFSKRFRNPVPGPHETLPIPKPRFPPEYPKAARARGLQGRVLLVSRINTDGALGPIWVARATAPVFGVAAAAAARRWTYRPATRDGEPIPYPAIQRIDYKMRH